MAGATELVEQVRDALVDAGATVDDDGTVHFQAGEIPPGPAGSSRRVSEDRQEREYRTAMVIDKVNLTTKKMKDLEGSAYEVPCLQVVLMLVAEHAADVAAAMCAFQGREVGVDISGEARQLSLF